MNDYLKNYKMYDPEIVQELWGKVVRSRCNSVAQPWYWCDSKHQLHQRNHIPFHQIDNNPHHFHYHCQHDNENNFNVLIIFTINVITIIIIIITRRPFPAKLLLHWELQPSQTFFIILKRIEWDNVWSRLSSHLQPFFLAHRAYFNNFYKKYHILTRRDKRESYLIVLQQNNV